MSREFRAPRRPAEAFLAVAEELHFGRAAERLRLSTLRVSNLIQAVERRAGAPLFERTSRVVRLTPAGTQPFGELRAGRPLRGALEPELTAKDIRGFFRALR